MQKKGYKIKKFKDTKNYKNIFLKIYQANKYIKLYKLIKK